jgi:hypothetical protein
MQQTEYEKKVREWEEYGLYDEDRAALITTETNKVVGLVTVNVNLWSRVGKPGGFLTVEFNPVAWNSEKDGILHKDKGFMEGLKKHLRICGVKCDTLDHHEDNKQSIDYVRLVVDEAFVKSYTLTYNLDKVYTFMVNGTYLDE